MATNLQQTAVATIIKQYFDSIAQGNKGSSKVEELTIDGSVVRFRVQIRHWHIWDGVFGDVTMYDITTPVQGDFDVMNPMTYKDINVCVDVGLGIGRVCVSLEQIATAVAAILI